MRKVIRIVLIAVVSLFAGAAIIGLLFGTKDTLEMPEKPADEPAQEQAEPKQDEQEPSSLVFESDSAAVEYGGIQDVAGNALVTFYLTSRTDATVNVVAENIIVNEQYAVESLSGSVVPIGPGKTGAVTLSFGVSVQTPLSGTDDIESLSADLVLVDESSFERIVSVPVSVTV